MQVRHLGRSGLQVSVLGLGTNAFGGRATAHAAKDVIAASLSCGMTFIDTANIYTGGQSETIIGEALRGRRHEATLATKAGLVAGPGPLDRGSSRLHLMRELEASLRRLQTDYIDLYQMHTFDAATPLEETLRTLDDMVRAGKVRYIGASNYRGWELMKALGLSDRLGLERYVSIQPSYSLADRVPEEELVPLCLDQGLGLIAYFPLAGGLLTGKYRPGAEPPPESRAAKAPAFGQKMLGSEARMALAAGVADMAHELSATPSQVALAWLIAQPAVATAIAGATRVEQVEENARAADLALDASALARLAELSRAFLHERFDEARLP